MKTKSGGLNLLYLKRSMERNNMEPQSKLIVDNQLWNLSSDMIMEAKRTLKELHPDLNKYELETFMNQVVGIKIRAILCTLETASYENITKVVLDKLNLNDLFDNRQKYLN